MCCEIQEHKKKDIQFAVIENTNAKSETRQQWALFAIIDFHNDVWNNLNSIYQAPIVNIYQNQKKGCNLTSLPFVFLETLD